MKAADLDITLSTAVGTVRAGVDLAAERPMRVLLISHTCQSKREGQPKAEQLGRMPGVELRVLSPDRWKMYGRWTPADAPQPGTSSFRYHVGRVSLPSAGPAQCYLHWYPGLRELLEEFKPHIIDLWEEPWGLVSAHTCWLRNRIVPTAKVISETEQNIEKRLPFPFERFRAYTLRNADFVVGRNTEAIEIVRRKGYRGPAQVVPNGVDAELFRPMDREKCRRELNLGGFVVGYVGRLVEEKGLDDLLDALARLPEQVNLVIAGGGPIEEALKRRAATMAISHRVRFLGSRPLHELPAIMNAFDVLAVPSRTTPRWKEQFGRVIIEAHACAIPVIGSSSGAIPEVVGEAGLIVRERDRDALARAVHKLASAPELVRKMGDLGKRAVAANFTWECVARRMHEIYLRSTAPSETVGVG
jgi:glycosyltransferase involved in cell wall biosynthesis